MAKVPIQCVGWVGCYSSRDYKFVHAHDHELGQVMLLVIPLLKNNGNEVVEDIHYFDIHSPISSSDGQWYVNRNILKKVEVSQSFDGGHRMRYLLSEFKMENDAFNQIPPDDVSKFVREIQLTFHKEKGQRLMDAVIWRRDKGMKIQKRFTKVDDSTAANKYLKMMDVNLKDRNERATRLFMDYRHKMWGITDGLLLGFLEDHENLKVVETSGVEDKHEAQDVCERWDSMSFLIGINK